MSAAGTACKRVAARSRLALAAFSINRRGVSGLLSVPAASASASPSSSGPFLFSNRRGQVLHISQFVVANGKRVDTLALVRRMEAQGVPTKHAEAAMSVITEVLNDNKAQLFVSKGEMQKSEMIHDADLSKLPSQVQSSQHLSSIMQKENEKLLCNVKKMPNELRSDIRDDPEKMCDEIRVKFEEIRRDLLHYFIGTIVWTFGVSLAVIRIPKKHKKQLIL